MNGYSTQTTTMGPPGTGSLHQLNMVNPPASDTDPKHGYLSAYYYEMNGDWTETRDAGALSYVPGSDQNVQVLWNLAKKWEVAGNLLQTNGGPSFIAHQFLIAGQSGALGNITPWEIVENPSVGGTPVGDLRDGWLQRHEL